MSKDQPDRLTFDGHDLTDYLWANPTRSLGLPINSVTVKVPGRPGERFVRRELEPLSIPVHVRLRATDADHEAVAKFRRRLTSILVTDGPRPLVLPDEPTVYYMAQLTDPGELDTLWHTGAASLEFTAYDPIAYGQDREQGLPQGASMVFCEGTWETRPVLDLEADGGCLSVEDDEGNRLELASDPEAGSSVVIDMDERMATADGETVPLVLGSVYWPLRPGRNDITVTGASGTIRWQERWA